MWRLVIKRESDDVLPQSIVLSCKIWPNISTVHLDISGMIHDFKFMEVVSKTKSRQECRHRISEGKIKKGTGRILPIPLVLCGVPNEI